MNLKELLEVQKELKKMDITLVEQYFRELREYNYINDIPLVTKSGIIKRKLLHPILLDLIKRDRINSHEELHVIADKRITSPRPRIYACTHIGGNDVQRAFEAIREHAYLFIGDLKEMYRDIYGLLVYLNGAVCLDTNSKTDRRIAYHRSLEVLRANLNLLIFPEGAWNITANEPVMPLYPGTVKMALETGADIIPVAIEQYENKFFVNIGENINVSAYFRNGNVEESLNAYLKEMLGTLKEEILHYFIYPLESITKRSSIPDNYATAFAQNIVDKCPYDFTTYDILKTRYRDKFAPEEVFRQIANIEKKDGSFQNIDHIIEAKKIVKSRKIA